MSTRRHRTGDHDHGDHGHGGRHVAPGKRTLTGALPGGHRDQAAKPAAERHLRADVTDLQPTEDGVRLVIGAGASHGLDESWRIHVLGCNLKWVVTEVHQSSAVVVSHGGQVDDVMGLTEVDLKGVPRAAEAPPPAPATEGGQADDPAWWTFED